MTKTAADLIAELQQMPPDTPVVLGEGIAADTAAAIEVVHMALKPGATRPTCEVPLRSRTVRIQGPGFHRDVELREYQMGSLGFPICAEIAFLLGLCAGAAFALIVCGALLFTR